MSRTVKLGHTNAPKEVSVECLCQHVHRGWEDIITRLVDDLFAMGWDGHVLQVKEKFGYLRFYVPNSTPEIAKRIQIAEDESSVTSEFSGKPGKRRDTGWLKVLDDEEYALYQETGSLHAVWEAAQKLNQVQCKSTKNQ